MHPRALPVLLLLTAGIGGQVLLAQRALQTASLHLLDVGQGDAILLRSGSTDILVDGGPDATVVQRLGAVRPFWDRTLEALILTHPQRDHLAGLLPLLERERIGLVLLPRLPAESDLARAFIAEVIRRGVPVRFAAVGQRIAAGRLRLTVLAPDARARALGRKNPNNGGIVLRADIAGGFSALLTGDIERPAEHLLVERSVAALDVDVLKVAHHGSKTSTTARLVRAASPLLALVSAGAGNRFGHPHAAVLGRLRAVPLLRTDRHGTVSLLERGGAVNLVCGHGCAPEDP